MNTISAPAPPTEVGQRVRARSYGGNVRQYHVDHYGTVVRFTAAGNPVVEIDHYITLKGTFVIGGHGFSKIPQVVDTYGCFRLVDENGLWVREELAVTQ